MALILKDRVKETSSSSGTGSVTLGGAFPGYQTFDAVVATGSTVYYTIHNLTAGDDDEFEVGVGTFTSPTTLSRDTVLSSSAGGTTKVNFTSGISGLEVFITQPAEEAIYLNQATGKVEVGGNGTNTVSFTNINATNLTANTVTLTAGTISTTPNAATDIANKQYVDEVAEGLLTKPAVEVATTGNLTSTYYNGVNDDGVGATLTATTNGAFPEIDGVTLTSTTLGENGVLVKNQTAGLQNGRYNLTTVGNGSTPWVLTRCALCDESSEIPGAFTFVKQGTLYAGTGWVQVVTDPATFQIGVDPIFVFQFSGAGTYTAGTGLTLTDTTFSITNTAVTPATYGNAGTVAQFTVNAQGQLTNAANVSINASSISVGTLANDRTTAASANGASTIVLRDSTGSFTANTITATTSNATTFNGTTGAFGSVSGNGVALTAINASNIASGTIANARTTGNTANSANTLVLRDASGNFGANTITATFSGNGATLSAINASNISSGTIDNARTTAASANGASTIVQRDSGGSFTANAGTFTSVSGNGVGLTAINASNIASGTIANARTTASAANGASTIVLRGASGEFAAGAITGTSFSGNGAAITAINASAITAGTLDNARTTASSANGASTIVARDSNGSFAANVGTFVTISGAHSGNGAGLTDINASNISTGTINNARTTAASANGANTIVARDANGSFAANVGTFTTVSGAGGGISGINGSNVTTGTVANARTTAATANGANTIVLRGASGEFAAGAITGVSFTGDGAAISNTNASNLSAGTINNARTTGASANGASTLVLRDANGSFAGNVITGTTGTFTNISGNGVSLTAINASNITSGTIANARTTASAANGASTIVARDANGSFAANVVTATSGSFTAVSGNGVALTALNGSNIASGTVANARTTAATANGASTIVLRGGSGEFTAGAITAVSFTGSGSGLTSIPNSATTASAANGANTIVARDASGNFTANAITATNFIGGGASISAINGSNVTTGTVANARTTASDANGASTIVSRSAAGSFAGNVITATTFSGSGASISAINASNVSTGTLVVGRGGTGQTTLTADNVILGNGANAVKVVAPGTANNVLTSNGSTWISQAAGGGGTTIPAGTVMIFGQTAAPTGFTKLTDQDNAGLRVVSGTASTGGSVDFTTAFASKAVTGSVSISAISGSAGNTTLSTPQIPSHSHTVTTTTDGGSFFQNSANGFSNSPGPYNTGNTGGGGAHSHPFSFSSGTASFSGTAINLAVKYVDVIRATKD
jgi:hypothetical protein